MEAFSEGSDGKDTTKGDTDLLVSIDTSTLQIRVTVQLVLLNCCFQPEKVAQLSQSIRFGTMAMTHWLRHNGQGKTAWAQC